MKKIMRALGESNSNHVDKHDGGYWWYKNGITKIYLGSTIAEAITKAKTMLSHKEETPQ